MKTLIIGAGEVGRALLEVLDGYYECKIKDKDDDIEFTPEIIHICFPYFDKFVSEVKKYQKLYSPKYTVIHSTVPVGVSRQCDAIHSPIRGIHPNLVGHIKEFVKFVAGSDVDVVAEYFRKVGLQIQLCRKQETTELAKILSTTRYGLDIQFAKETEKLCDEYDVPFSEVYTLWTQTYNEGYEKQGLNNFTRPILQPIQIKIGGHCVMPNARLLKSKLTNLLLEL